MTEITWTKELHMIEGVEVRTGHDEHYWYASTAVSPHFLLQAETEDEVIHMASKILEAYKRI